MLDRLLFRPAKLLRNTVLMLVMSELHHAYFIRTDALSFCAHHVRVLVRLVLRPRVAVALHFERVLREQQPIAVLRLVQRHRQWTPGHQANADLVVHLGQVQFALLAAEHVVLGLLDDRRHAVELPAVGVGFHDLRSDGNTLTVTCCVHNEHNVYEPQLASSATCPSTWPSPVGSRASWPERFLCGEMSVDEL